MRNWPQQWAKIRSHISMSRRWSANAARRSTVIICWTPSRYFRTMSHRRSVPRINRLAWLSPICSTRWACGRRPRPRCTSSSIWRTCSCWRSTTSTNCRAPWTNPSSGNCCSCCNWKMCWMLVGYCKQLQTTTTAATTSTSAQKQPQQQPQQIQGSPHRGHPPVVERANCSSTRN